jgi:aminoglycoside 3-N-acetyltransferase I
MKTTFSRLLDNDILPLSELIQLYARVFERENFKLPSHEYLQTLLNDRSIIFIAAVQDKKVIGGLSAHVLPSVYEPCNELYIYDFAVHPSFQRTGIGRQLLLELKQYGNPTNAKVIFVQADKEDDHALDFYRATGGHEAQVVHYTYNC